MVNIVNLVGLGAVVIVGILIFTQFQKLGGFLGALKFPEIKLPEVNLNLGGFGAPAGESLVEAGLIDPIIDPESGESRISEDTPTGGIGLAGAFGDRLRDFFNRPSGETPAPFRDAEMFARDFPEDFIEAAPSNTQNLFGDINEQKITETEVPSPFGGQQFFGGGPSFIGGQVLETPISNLSLSQIIDREPVLLMILGILILALTRVGGSVQYFPPLVLFYLILVRLVMINLRVYQLKK